MLNKMMYPTDLAARVAAVLSGEQRDARALPGVCGNAHPFAESPNPSQGSLGQ
jgi:hypothetical protein